MVQDMSIPTGKIKLIFACRPCGMHFLYSIRDYLYFKTDAYQ
jgi:hypothetical protein